MKGQDNFEGLKKEIIKIEDMQDKKYKELVSLEDDEIEIFKIQKSRTNELEELYDRYNKDPEISKSIDYCQENLDNSVRDIKNLINNERADIKSDIRLLDDKKDEKYKNLKVWGDNNGN